MYVLKEDGCVPFELTREEYQKCVTTIHKMRVSDFEKALDRALQTCGMDVIRDKLAKKGIIEI